MGGNNGSNGNGDNLIEKLRNCYVKIQFDQKSLPPNYKSARFVIGKLTAYDSTHIQLHPYVEFNAGLDSKIDKQIEKLKGKLEKMGNSTEPTIPKQFPREDLGPYEELIIILEED